MPAFFIAAYKSWCIYVMKRGLLGKLAFGVRCLIIKIYELFSDGKKKFQIESLISQKGYVIRQNDFLWLVKKADTTTSTKLRAYFNRNGLSEKNVLLEKIGKDQIVHPLNVHIKTSLGSIKKKIFCFDLDPILGSIFTSFYCSRSNQNGTYLWQVG